LKAVLNPSNIGLFSSIPKIWLAGLAVFAQTLMNVNKLHPAFHSGYYWQPGLWKCGIDVGGALGREAV